MALVWIVEVKAFEDHVPLVQVGVMVFEDHVVVWQESVKSTLKALACRHKRSLTRLLLIETQSHRPVPWIQEGKVCVVRVFAEVTVNAPWSVIDLALSVSVDQDEGCESAHVHVDLTNNHREYEFLDSSSPVDVLGHVDLGLCRDYGPCQISDANHTDDQDICHPVGHTQIDHNSCSAQANHVYHSQWDYSNNGGEVDSSHHGSRTMEVDRELVADNRTVDVVVAVDHTKAVSVSVVGMQRRMVAEVEIPSVVDRVVVRVVELSTRQMKARLLMEV